MTKDSVDINHFNRGKPFYPHILLYLATFHGIIELISRGVVKKVHNPKTSHPESEEEILKLSTKEKGNKFLMTASKSSFTPLIGKPSLRSKSPNNSIEIDTEILAQEFVENNAYLSEFYLKAGNNLLLAAYEATKEKHTHNELWEFLYHCRNAAAHNNIIDDKHKRLEKYNARWNKFDISKNIGKKLFQDNIESNGHFLDPADPIRLLWDIEQKLL